MYSPDVSQALQQVQYRWKICGPKCACKTRLPVKHAGVCVFDTRMKYTHKAKLISIYELAHCRPTCIVVISLLVLIAFYCINVYGNGYSAEHRLANPAPCLFQLTGKHVEISSGVFLIKKKNVTIRSRNIYVGRMKLLTLSRFQHFPKPCGTSDTKI